MSKTKGKIIVFTNGCFDIIHPGHVALLARAKSLGDRLIVGINSDESVRRIKGEGRPLQNEAARKAVLLALAAVDEVYVFEELTPENLIKQIKPNVLVKGGDWSPEEIIGGDFVLANGGRVVTIPLADGHSSSSIVGRIARPADKTENKSDGVVEASLKQHIDLFQNIVVANSDSIYGCGNLILDTLKSGRKLLLCGNGGSAADAQHIAAEFVGRYENERRAFPAIALTTDTSALTALANDYDFERIFARQVDALAQEGDCLIAISTSGNSPNVLAAMMAARRRGCRVIGMTGAKGKKLASLSDACILVPSDRTSRIQEAHIAIAHIWCELVDANFPSEPAIS